MLFYNKGTLTSGNRTAHNSFQNYHWRRQGVAMCLILLLLSTGADMEMKVVVDKTEVEIRVANDDLRDLSELQLALIGGGIGETVL